MDPVRPLMGALGQVFMLIGSAYLQYSFLPTPLHVQISNSYCRLELSPISYSSLNFLYLKEIKPQILNNQIHSLVLLRTEL